MVLSNAEFREVALQHDLDALAITEHLRKLFPDKTFKAARIEQRIANHKRKGYLPLDSGNYVGKGEILKGTSTRYDEHGAIKSQWVKTDIPKENMLEAFGSAIDSILGPLPPKPTTIAPKIADNMKELLSVYTIGDAHVGMLAWGPESGEDNDLVTAEERHLAAMELLIAQSQPSEEAFIVDVGDFFHSDNVDNRTAASGHSLDVDGRYAKVLEIGLNLTTKLIDLALAKHATVRWRSAIGNHNEHSAIMMNKFIKAYYRHDPRIIVHDEPGTFMYHQFGKNLIGITHGNTVKAEKLGEIMSVDCEDIWSSTSFRYWYTGHVHHQSVKEFPSCVVETFRTLSGKDAWHSSKGYRSKQDMRCILLHKDHGEVSRNTVNLTMIT